MSQREAVGPERGCSCKPVPFCFCWTPSLYFHEASISPSRFATEIACAIHTISAYNMADKVTLPRKTKKSRKRNWKEISLQDEEIFELKEEGLISLEELADYQIEDYQRSSYSATKKRNSDKRREGEGLTKSARTKKSKSLVKSKKKKRTVAGVFHKEVKAHVNTSSRKEAVEELGANDNDVDDNEVGNDATSKSGSPIDNITFKCDMSDWKGLGVPEPILAAISEKGFTTPTPIQAASLPFSIFQYQDIIGAAETGSGKTMAFLLPILTHILEFKRKRMIKANSSSGKDDSSKSPIYALILTPTRELALQIYKNLKELSKYIEVNSAAVVGGLSVQKQERLLKKHPEIVVGTPGRLLSKINDRELQLEHIKFLVLDEVDRMLEFGHFKEASEILRLLSLSKSKWQTYLLSATLTVPQYHKKWSGKFKSDSEQETVQKLVDKAKMSSKAKIIDLTRKNIAAEQIQQHRIICTDDEKDVYLFYIMLSHPGRTLIFVNSINCTRKISSFLAILGKNPMQLHAGKQQRQRLKALDRFMANSDAIMVATDVAARGLDIPNVDTVIHYHLPKDPKLYIHRSGRTARANKAGQSIILEGPKDFREYRKIYSLMKLTSDLPPLEVDDRVLPDVKKRVDLARSIDKEEHLQKKKATEKNWFERAAKSLDLELEDSDDYMDGRKKKSINKKLNILKKELQQLLQRPLIPRGFSGSYITKSGKLEMLKV